MAIYEIPLTPQEQRFNIQLSARSLRLRVYWCDTPEGGWALDILLPDDTPVICGIMLVPQVNLLAQHEYLGLDGALVLVCDSTPAAPPTRDGLGTDAHLMWAEAA